MAWTGLTLTVDGRNALIRAQEEGKLCIKSLVVGDGAPPANFGTQKGLVHMLYELTDLKIDMTEDGCALTADFPVVDYDYYFREIGVVAVTEDGEKLYVYDNCGDDAQYIVSTTGAERTQKRIRLYLTISDVADITVSAPSILYVAYDAYEKDIEELNQKIDIKAPADKTFLSRSIFAGDIDTLRGPGKSGSYWVQPVSYGTTSASGSIPFGPDNYYDLHVFAKNTSDATQMAICFESNGRNDVRYRIYANGKWYPWSTRLGTANISGIGDGSVTGAISAHAGTAASATVPGHTKFGTTAGTACQGNDSRLSNARTPIAHASAATTYGVGNASNYGHVKLSDTYTSSVGASASAIGASQAALYNAYDVLNKKFGGYLSLTGGTLSGDIYLANAKSLKTKTTIGINTILITMNDKNNIHIGDYNGANSSPVYLHAYGATYNFLATSFISSSNGHIDLGDSSHLWKTIHAKTGTINTSDRTKKHDIRAISEVYERLFLSLQPKSFMFDDGDRVHIGAISQDVEDAMKELGIEPEQFAGFCKDVRYEYTEFNEEDGTPVESSKVPCRDENGNIIYDYALRYQEFIFLTIHMTQRLWEKTALLEKENLAIKDKLRALEKKLN